MRKIYENPAHTKPPNLPPLQVKWSAPKLLHTCGDDVITLTYFHFVQVIVVANPFIECTLLFRLPFKRIQIIKDKE